MDYSSINVSLENTERYYLNGQYSKYKVFLDKIREELNDSTFSDLGIDHSTLSTILENNLLVAECLELKWEADNAEKMWDQLLLRFGNLHQRCTDTHLKIASQEFHLWLTLVHNYLFWSWVNPQVEKNNNSNHIEEKLQLVMRCLNLVLESFDKPCLAVESLSSKMMVLHLMKLSSTCNILFYSEGTHNIGLQLLEIYFLSVQIIIESFDSTSRKPDVYSLESCADFIQNIVNLKHAFETCCRTHREENPCSRSTGINVSQFKFGLHQINCRVGDFDIDAIFNAFCFAGSLCYLKIDQFKKSLACLSQPNTTCENDGKPSFILNYLKSCIYFKLDDVEKSLLFLRKILDLTLDCNMMARSVLLYGLILSYKGQFLYAQNEFAKVQKIEPYLPLALYYSAINYKSYAQSHSNDGEVSIWRGCQSEDQRKRFREAVPINELATTALNALVNSLKHHDNTGIKLNNYSASLELKLLSIIHPQPEITASRAIYLLARELTAGRKFSHSADKLLYLLTDQCDHHLDQIGLAISLSVPPTNILMNETTAVLIQAERWKDAEIVCKQSLSACASLGEALIPNMFLAQIQDYKEEEGDALNTLTKCLNSVDQWVAHHATEYMKHEPEATYEELGKRIAAKACVQIALIYTDRQSPDVAEKHLKRALCYSKTDKDALYHLLLLLKNRISTSHELWERHQATFNNVDKGFTNIALDYLLCTQVTKEQLEKLSVHFLMSTPNFLEELEDMDAD